MRTSISQRTLSLAALLGLACHEANPHANGTIDSLQVAASATDSAVRHPVPVSLHWVGPIPLDSSFAYLALHFPTFRADTEFVEGIPYPTWTFRVADVSATAVHTFAVTDSTQGPELWKVAGSGILLSDSIPMPTSWGQLRERFPGPAQLSFGELGPSVAICALPGLTFFTTFPYSLEDQDTMSTGGIPPSAPLGYIAIEPRHPPNTPCPNPAGLPN